MHVHVLIMNSMCLHGSTARAAADPLLAEGVCEDVKGEAFEFLLGSAPRGIELRGPARPSRSSRDYRHRAMLPMASISTRIHNVGVSRMQ